MKTVKRFVSALLSLLTVLTVFVFLPVPASAESLYIRKIVSVVYDDSGSMLGEKWAYANYAMQMFCGMLNSEDQLYITYMSEFRGNTVPSDAKKIDLSKDGIQSSVNSIRNHTNTYGTPFAAVEFAFDKLKSVQDSNPNTQYWLVVITDGEFQECSDQNMNRDQVKKFLNDTFEGYSDVKMPNGTKPQINFLGIGDVTAPDKNENKGIYPYTAKDAAGIVSAMNKLADRVSGRTRLQKSEIEKVDEKTVRVSSTIPLLNIAVFTQGTSVKLDDVFYAGSNDEITVSRSVSLNYNNRKDLSGGAYLVGDSQNVIGASSYDLVFNGEIDLDEIIVLFEPALEVRTKILVNGKEISSPSDLDNVTEGDKISVSYKIYEMGTDTEISPSLMPSGTKFELAVTEDGKIVKQVTDSSMSLNDYILKNIETEISAAVKIEGFNPIDYTVSFTPNKYVPPTVYTITPSFGSDVKSVKFDDIALNKDLTVCFTVYADGVQMTDPEAVKKLNPVITASPQGNSGTVTYSPDGKIVFTPNAAPIVQTSSGSFSVSVSCSISDGTSASESYTVLISDFRIVPANATGSVKKNELFQNKESVSFYITKDGVRLNKAEIENGISISLNKAHNGLKADITVSDDGLITVLPHAKEQYELNFFSWWVNYWKYWSISSSDIKVTLSHPYGTSTATVDVTEASVGYVILNVYLPLLLEILIISAIIAYIIRYITKPRFAPNGVLYVGSITRNRRLVGTHYIGLSEIGLARYNKFKNLWNPFKPLTVNAGGVSITAVKGNRIQCNEAFPWYSSGISAKQRTLRIGSPKDVVNICAETNNDLLINEIKPTTVMDEQQRAIMQDDSVYYFVNADITYEKMGSRQIEVIDSAVAFCYSTIQN